MRPSTTSRNYKVSSPARSGTVTSSKCNHPLLSTPTGAVAYLCTAHPDSKRNRPCYDDEISACTPGSPARVNPVTAHPSTLTCSNKGRRTQSDWLRVWRLWWLVSGSGTCASARWIRTRNASSTARFWTGSSRTKPRAGTRPDRKLAELLRFARNGDIVIVHSMDRLARNLDDLRSLVQTLTRKGVRVEFVKESLVFTGEDSPMANLMLSVMGAFAEFERSLIRERQREGIALAKQRGAYKGRKRPSHRNGRPSWYSGPTAGFPSPSSPATMASAGKRSVIGVKTAGVEVAARTPVPRRIQRFRRSVRPCCRERSRS
jgi:hypothetical protein